MSEEWKTQLGCGPVSAPDAAQDYPLHEEHFQPYFKAEIETEIPASFEGWCGWS